MGNDWKFMRKLKAKVQRRRQRQEQHEQEQKQQPTSFSNLNPDLLFTLNPHLLPSKGKCKNGLEELQNETTDNDDVVVSSSSSSSFPSCSYSFEKVSSSSNCSLTFQTLQTPNHDNLILIEKEVEEEGDLTFQNLQTPNHDNLILIEKEVEEEGGDMGMESGDMMLDWED